MWNLKYVVGEKRRAYAFKECHRVLAPFDFKPSASFSLYNKEKSHFKFMGCSSHLLEKFWPKKIRADPAPFRKSAKIAENLGYRHFYVKLKPTIFGLRRYNSIILDEMSKGGVFDEIKFQNFIKFEFIWIKILNFYEFSTWKNL